MEGYLRVGMILRPHGVRGAVKLLPLTEDLSRFRRLKSCFLERDGAYVPIEVQAASPQQDGVILQLSCAHTREEAEGLRNLYVCVDRAHAVKLPPGRYFVTDMIGCRVEDSQGKPLGVLQEVLETGANDVYVIQGDRQLLVPALKKLLTLVDVAHKRIVLDAAVLEEVGLFAD